MSLTMPPPGFSFRVLTLVFLATLTAVVAYSQLSNRGMGPLLDRASVKLGQPIPQGLVIYTATGEPKPLAQITKGRYTVIVSGCLTCPIFHRTYPSVEAVRADYKDRDDVQFFFMYKSLAHPELNGYVQPMTLDERLAHIEEAKRTLGTTIPWLCDGTANQVRHTLGFGPNTQIILGPDGKVVHALGWSDGEVLRSELVSLVGKSETHTQTADLDLKRIPPYKTQRAYSQGVLDKPVFDSELAPVKITPLSDADTPLYVKPRIEVDQNVLQNGNGELYLGFFLDPIHRVHWNNLADPLKYEIVLPEGTEISPAQGTAPRVTQETDSDPREFALEVAHLGENKTAQLKIHYYACSNEEGWCLPVTQTYEIAFQRDLDGGGTVGRSFRAGNAGGRGPRPGGASERARGANADQMKQRILNMDANGDGSISIDEAPEGMRRRFPQMDRNSDGQLDEAEIEQMLQRRNPGDRGRRNAPPFDPEAIKTRIMNADSDGDGRITREELPSQMQRRFDQMDANGDGWLEEDEIDTMLQNRPQGQQGRRPEGPRGRSNRN